MSEQPRENVFANATIIQRTLERPILAVQRDSNGFVHLLVGDADEEGALDIVEDFVIIPPVGKQVGDLMFKASTEAEADYARTCEAIAQQQADEDGSDTDN